VTRTQVTAELEVHIAAAGEVADIGLLAVHRTVLVVVALHTGLEAVVLHIVLVAAALHTVLVAARHIDLEVVHRTGPAEAAAGPTAAAEEELRTGPEEVDHHTG
jgi:hypothetical protein